MFDSPTQIISKQLYVGQSFQISNPSVEVNYLKTSVSLLNTTQMLGDSQIKISSFCDLLASDPSLNCQSSNVIQKVITSLKVQKNLRLIFLIIHFKRA